VAEEPTPPKAEKGSLLKGKWHGVPKPLLLIGGGVVLYLGYRWYQNRNTSSTTTPSTTSTGQTTGDTTGDGGGFGGGGGYQPPNSSGVTPITPAAATNPTTPTGVSASTAAVSNVIPLGTQTFTVAGKAFNGASSFTEGGNTYYGINNPAEAQALEKLGVVLVHRPGDPTSALFARTTAGSKVVKQNKPAEKIAKPATPTAKPATRANPAPVAAAPSVTVAPKVPTIAGRTNTKPTKVTPTIGGRRG